MRLLPACLMLALSTPAGATAADLPPNWPLAPSQLEQRFATGSFRILEAKGAGAGVTGASKLKVRYDDGLELKVKWKPVPPRSADGWNNSPRKEMAAYEVQRWLADEQDFLVPTLAPRCLALGEAAPVDPHAKPSLKGSNCLLGVIAVWLADVTAPETFYDEERFANDPAYARYLSDFNVLTYLIEHKDGRRGNLLLSTAAGQPRVFAVDNGIAFDPFPWNFLVENWNRIRVPWLRKETVERLRKIDRAAIGRLAVVAEMEMDADGVYRVVTPGPAFGDDDDGVRRRGNRVQFGLTEDEIEDVGERLESLLKKVDSGRIAVR